MTANSIQEDVLESLLSLINTRSNVGPRNVLVTRDEAWRPTISVRAPERLGVEVRFYGETTDVFIDDLPALTEFSIRNLPAREELLELISGVLTSGYWRQDGRMCTSNVPLGFAVDRTNGPTYWTANFMKRACALRKSWTKIPSINESLAG